MAEFKTDIKLHGTALEAIASHNIESTTLTHQEAIDIEHTLTLRQAVRLYPKAIGWSIFVSLGVIMLGFDPQLIGNLYASPQFVADFGQVDADGNYNLSASWQVALSLGNPLGEVIGALAAGYPIDWFGCKKTFAACTFLTGCTVFIQFFATSISVLLVGELLAGIVLGMYVVIAPTYASEVLPLALRGYLNAYVNLCFVIGQLLANGVTAGTQGMDSHWAYSIPFSLQWFWIAVLTPGLFFIPESPWWLARQGRLEDATKSLRRLVSRDFDVTTTLATIVNTDRLEQELQAGVTFFDCLKGTNRRRTEISIGVATAQVFSGIYLINYGTYFFQQAGLATDQAFNMGVAFLGLGFIGTVTAWFLLPRLGRRTLYVGGLGVLTISQYIIGILACIPGSPSAAIWALSAVMLVWNFLYDATIGPVCFVILGECSATRVRAKTIAISIAAQGAAGIVTGVAVPYLINPGEANLQGKLGFVSGSLALMCFIWGYFRIPETKNRTFEELDLLFDQKVAARKFKGYDLNIERSD